MNKATAASIQILASFRIFRMIFSILAR